MTALWRGLRAIARRIARLFWPAVPALVFAIPAHAQYRADSITVSKASHDAFQAVQGLAVTMTLRELGVRPVPALLVGSVGVTAVAVGLKCALWCGTDADWPVRVVWRDAVYEVVLRAAALPVLVGRHHGWRAGALTGAAWLGVVLLLDQGFKWGSP